MDFINLDGIVRDTTNTVPLLDGSSVDVLLAGIAWAIICGLVVIPLGLAAAAILGRIRRMLLRVTIRHMFRRTGTIVAEYTPPFGLTPAEFGYLYDLSFGIEEYLAMLFYLEKRGYVSLLPTDKVDDFMIKIAKDFYDEPMSDIERHVLATITAIAERHHVLWSRFRASYESNGLGDASLVTIVEDSLVERGLLKYDTRRSIFWSLSTALGIVVMLVSLVFLAFNAIGLMHYVVIICFVWILLSWEVLTRAYRSKSRVLKRGTSLLYRFWRQIEGYRMFVEVVELDKLQFENQRDADGYLSEVLPYAIALNLTTRWQDRFNG